MNNDELMHWGILGMKWGVRRYQNKDGSLTAAGKKRYGYENMSNDELRKAINRKVLENRYNELKSNTGEYKKQKDDLDLASKAVSTIGDVSKTASKAFELGGKKDYKSYTDVITKTSEKLSKSLSDSKNKVKADYDFSNVSDEELRNLVERMNLEQQYTKYYGSPVEDRGRESAKATLETIGTVASLAATGLGIALTIKKLKEN